MSEKEITGVLKEPHWDNLRNVYWGYIYNDVRGRFTDGTLVRTSLVIKIDRDKDGKPVYCDTLNSRYKLE